MRLKKDVNLVEFLKQIKTCKSDVYLETEDEDKLNLKSVLSRYVLIVLAKQPDVLENSRVICSEEDREKLMRFMMN